MELHGVEDGDRVNGVNSVQREVVVISDSSEDSTSEAHSNVECATRENPDSAGGLLEAVEESVRSICDAIQHLRLALAVTLERIQLEIEFLEEYQMLEAAALRPHLNLCRGLLLHELHEIETLRRRHDHGEPLPKRRNTAA